MNLIIYFRHHCEQKSSCPTENKVIVEMLDNVDKKVDTLPKFMLNPYFLLISNAIV